MLDQKVVETVVRSTNGRFFGVQFVKRTTGELHTMLARTGVRAYIKGGARAYEPADHRLVFVFDVHKMQYRSIPIDSVVKINFRRTYSG